MDGEGNRQKIGTGEDGGEEDEAGRMTDSPRRCPAVCLLLVRRWRGGERLAMVWTVKTSDGAEGEARNGR